MKTKHILSSIAMLAMVTNASAATVVAGDPVAGGIDYDFSVTLSETDNGSLSAHTGAWSWEDQGIAPGGGEGWTHTSQWVAVTLLSPLQLTLTLSANATVPFSGSGNVGGFAATDNFFPGFTIYAGQDHDAMSAAAATLLGYDPLTPPNDHHTYANSNNVVWAEDISYVAHANTTTAQTLTSTWTLAAGTYSIVLGSDAPSASSPPRQGFLAQFSTAAVPEPASFVLMSAGLLGLLRRRR